MNDREKAIDKIKKCLALSKSANEHEAAAALRQAQALMRKHDVTEDDVEGTDYVTAVIPTDYEFGKRKPLVIVAVANLIQHAMGVDCLMGAVRTSTERGLVHSVTYVGPRSRIHIAQFAHTVVYRAVGQAWKKFSNENPHVKKQQGARAGFYAGWCRAVKNKVEELVVTEKEQAGIKRALDRHFPGRDKAEVGKTKISGATYAAGAELGSEFELNKPIGQSRIAIEDKS